MASSPQVHSYARAGTNDVSAHAVGLEGLISPARASSSTPSTPPTSSGATADCLPRADALIIDDSLRPEAGEPDWNAYVTRVRALVADGYDCQRTGGSEPRASRG